MTTARQFYDQPDLSEVEPKKDWLTMYDLPSEDPEEPGLPDVFHDLQPQLLSATLQLPGIPKNQVFTGTDLNFYYDQDNPRWYKRPDWFVVTGVPRLYAKKDLRLSYVIWDENASPSIVVELISPGTLMSDLGEIPREQNGTPTKWQVYEEITQIPYYVVYDRYKDRIWLFKLINGKYQEQNWTNGKIWLDDLNIGLGLWDGEFHGITRSWLRWYDKHGDWIPTDSELERQRRIESEEQTEIERQRAEMEHQRAETEKQRAERLAEHLRSLGVDPENL